MPIDIEVKADSTQIQVTVPQANLSWNLANSVAYHVSTNLIVDTGESEDDIEKRILKVKDYSLWESVKSQVSFTAPFAVESFHPTFAQEIVRYYTYRTRKALNRGILSLFDRFNYHLQIADYESVPSDKCRDFAYLLYKHLKPRLLVINGVPFDPRPYRAAELSLRLFKYVGTLAVLAAVFASSLSFVRFHKIWWGFIVLGIAFISIIGLEYGFPMLWAVVMRNFLPAHAMLVLLPSLRLTSRTRDKLCAMLRRIEMENTCK